MSQNWDLLEQIYHRQHLNLLRNKFSFHIKFTCLETFLEILRTQIFTFELVNPNFHSPPSVDKGMSTKNVSISFIKLNSKNFCGILLVRSLISESVLLVNKVIKLQFFHLVYMYWIS